MPDDLAKVGLASAVTNRKPFVRIDEPGANV
jgi:hypothetical protein